MDFFNLDEKEKAIFTKGPELQGKLYINLPKIFFLQKNNLFIFFHLTWWLIMMLSNSHWNIFLIFFSSCFTLSELNANPYLIMDISFKKVYSRYGIL